ncbi:hypothetical protein [Actinorugispora endophytica]|uniref:Uncharacterized protein n=1 Tax=Actinorugispora endophytica TaxID=1605990 RepID=A0A4R6V413_9ACTN|nr:hypothetical protein [Actinorugispora endophytica]TDQ53468.1 hypothetical protein EV190_104258 [Actinorugispora endophytica]
MSNGRHIKARSLSTEPIATDEARKLLTEEMERLGARSAVDAARRSAPRDTEHRSASSARRRSPDRHR